MIHSDHQDSSDDSALIEHLQRFDELHGVSGRKSRLCVLLGLTKRFSSSEFPLVREQHLTENKGQLKGLGRSRIQKILSEHGVAGELAKEGGRTMQSGLGLLDSYLAEVNELQACGKWNPRIAERWWIDCARGFLKKAEQAPRQPKPLRFKVDPSKSVRSGLRDLFAQIQKRQSDAGGLKFVGAVYQHLVGAKLEIILGKSLKHHAHSTADAPTGRSGDFVIDKTAIHVTTAPGEALIGKCRQNLDAGIHPIIVTTPRGCITGEDLAGEDADRIEFIDIEQFLTANIHEWGKFDVANRRKSLERLIAGYNAIVDANERTPGLTIEMQ